MQNISNYNDNADSQIKKKITTNLIKRIQEVFELVRNKEQTDLEISQESLTLAQ